MKIVFLNDMIYDYAFQDESATWTTGGAGASAMDAGQGNGCRRVGGDGRRPAGGTLSWTGR